MAEQLTIHRYTAYFRGWAQAFGEHEGIEEEAHDLHWLIGPHQLGLILTPTVKRPLFRELLGKGDQAPDIQITRSEVQVGDHLLRASDYEPRALALLSSLVVGSTDLHLFLSYHLFYPSGTRILTLSKNPPLTIIYKEIGPFVAHVSLD